VDLGGLQRSAAGGVGGSFRRAGTAAGGRPDPPLSFSSGGFLSSSFSLASESKWRTAAGEPSAEADLGGLPAGGVG
jgi:hypothetical protein